MDKKELGCNIAIGAGIGIILGYGLHNIGAGIMCGIGYVLLALLISKLRK